MEFLVKVYQREKAINRHCIGKEVTIYMSDFPYAYEGDLGLRSTLRDYRLEGNMRGDSEGG